MTALLLFGATFALVMALGFQQLNVSGGHRVLAFVTGVGIQLAQLVVLKVVPGPTSPEELTAYLLGGPAGILCAMSLHPRLVRWLGLRAGQPS